MGQSKCSQAGVDGLKNVPNSQERLAYRVNWPQQTLPVLLVELTFTQSRRFMAYSEDASCTNSWEESLPLLLPLHQKKKKKKSPPDTLPAHQKSWRPIPLRRNGIKCFNMHISWTDRGVNFLYLFLGTNWSLVRVPAPPAMIPQGLPRSLVITDQAWRNYEEICNFCPHFSRPLAI